MHSTLEKPGIAALVNSPVAEVSAEGLRTADGTFIPATLKVRAAGIRAPEFLAELDGPESKRINQLAVEPTLQTTPTSTSSPSATAPPAMADGKNVPPHAQAAHQQASLLAKSPARRLQGKPLPAYRYRDYGSLISLSSFSAAGNLMGNLTGDVMLEGRLTRWFYISLYRLQQMALSGAFRTLLPMLSDRLGRSTEPRLKLL